MTYKYMVYNDEAHIFLDFMNARARWFFAGLSASICCELIFAAQR